MMFAKAFVINLPFKKDRLATFLATVPKCFGEITVWPAVHGDAIRHPDWWKAGAGAWGCYRSHLQILEHCYQNDIESYLVFEDDAIFRADIESRLKPFFDTLPADWEQIYLGGQLLHEVQHPPTRITDSVYTPFNVNRTHCFAVHRRGYETLYKHLNAVPFVESEHIDHHLGRLHESKRLKVYCPARWLVGQDGGSSNISGNNNSASFWIDPEKLSEGNRAPNTRRIPAIFLDAPLAVALELEKRGWHRGHWQNNDRLDRGVCSALVSLDVQAGLHDWHKAVMPEAVRQGSACICLFHPSLSWSYVKSLDFADFRRVHSESADDGEQQLLAIQQELDTEWRNVTTSTTIQARNLIYHIWPKRGNGTWQWNVEQLLKRIEQFDGVRSIGVATSEDADSVETVQNAFADVRIDNWLIVENNPELGEVTTFSKLLTTVPKDDSITFYSHAKGVKYANSKETRAWTDMMYEVCLDDHQYVNASLEQFPVTGPFINTQPWNDGAKYGWHFAGSFFWFRNRDVFARSDWNVIRQFYWGSELWPGSLFTRKQAGELFGQECGRLYDASELARMQAWLVEWRLRRRPEDRTATPEAQSTSISIIIPTLGRPNLKCMLADILRQVQTQDEIIVVADELVDGAVERTEQICGEFSRSAKLLVTAIADEQSSYGNAQRNHGMSIATGGLIWFCDDDDQTLPNALVSIRKGANRNAATMFRIEHRGQTIWNQRTIDPGNVSAQMLVAPNTHDLPRFPVPAENPSLSDYEWIRAVEKRMPIQWNESIIYQIQSHSAGKLAS